MDAIVQCGEFLGNSFTQLWNAVGTWGIFGIGIIAPAILKRVGYLVKRIFEF